jgi:hypothetical protein
MPKYKIELFHLTIFLFNMVESAEASATMPGRIAENLLRKETKSVPPPPPLPRKWTEIPGDRLPRDQIVRYRCQRIIGKNARKLGRKP